MSSDGSVTQWFHLIEQGDSLAVRSLWERYFPELVRLARKKLQTARRGATDEEDVALGAMDSFFHAAQQGRFPNVADRHDLFRLLLQITARKVIDHHRREGSLRRGAGRVRFEADLRESEFDEPLLAGAIGDVPSPEFAAMMAEECGRLLAILAEPDLKELAIAKMEGYTNREIALRFDCSERTIERRLCLIRKKWQQDLPP